MDRIHLEGAEAVARAGHNMSAAAADMLRAAQAIEDSFARRRQWEEEYLQRIAAIVQEELDFYRTKE